MKQKHFYRVIDNFSQVVCEYNLTLKKARELKKELLDCYKCPRYNKIRTRSLIVIDKQNSKY